jgi:hypothetical protein
MKKVIFSLFAASLMLLGTNAFAQISVNAGYLNSTLASSNSSANANGAYAGFSFNLPIAGGLGIAPGVYYSMITGKTLDLGTIATGTLMEHAVNVPVYVNYGFELSRDTKLFVFGGPTLQYGLASSTKLSSGLTDKSLTSDNYKDADYNRMNVYLGGGIGFGISALQITVGYDYGMMNQYKNTDASYHRSNLKLGVGFAF